MGVVAEHIGRAADGERAKAASGEELAGINDVHRAESEPFVDVLLLAEQGRGEHLDGEAVASALGEFLAGPDRPAMIGLAGLVDMRPFQHLGLLRKCGCGEGSRDAKASGTDDDDMSSQGRPFRPVVC
jgi:hypothetical protein